jgi:hypothetical protein
MNTFFYYALSWPFILLELVMSFIMWNLLSTGDWKTRKPGFNPIFLYQDQISSLTRQMREREMVHRAEIEKLEQRHRKELQQLRRKNIN